MDITLETEPQSRNRLLRVLAAAHVEWLSGEYAWEEWSSGQLSDKVLDGALAAVRDGAHWSVLKAANLQSPERFCLFQCHFIADIPNSGFVGWLATEFKRELGTGVFVVCGQNSARGGIFDYWGLPAALRDTAADLLESLRAVSLYAE